MVVLGADNASPTRGPDEEPIDPVLGLKPRRALNLPAPANVSAEAGADQVTLYWSTVDGAAGYVINHANAPGGRLWPDAKRWEELRARDRLAEQRLAALPVRDGSTELEIELPMPGVAQLRLEPQ